MSRRFARGALLCLLPPLIWGGMFPVANLLVPTVNMFVATLIRYGAVAVIFAVILVRVEGRSAFSLERRGWKLFALGSAGFAGFGLLAFTALSYTSASNVSLVMALLPAISAVMAAAATRRFPPVVTLIAIAIAFVGVWLVLTHGDFARPISPTDALGEGLALLGAICWAFYTRGVATAPGWSALRYTTLTTLLGVPTIAVATVVATAVGFVEAPTWSALAAGWLELLYLIIPGGIVAVLAWNQGNKILGPVNGSLFMNLVPVTTFTIVTIATGKLPAATALLGVALVIVGLVVNNVFMRRTAAAEATPAAASTTATPE